MSKRTSKSAGARLFEGVGRLRRLAAGLAIVAAAMFLSGTLHAQGAMRLSEVRRVFVRPLNGSGGAAALREDLIKKLRRSGQFDVVANAAEADASIGGTGQIWVKGHYAVNPRTPGNNLQSVYGGYLSIEVSGKAGEPLWSYLTTPSRFAMGGITSDLTQGMVKALVEAKHAGARNSGGSSDTGKNEAAVAGTGASGSAQIALHGAGATFPAPLYQKWFQSFERERPTIHVRYDATGSEAGVQALSRGEVDFAASDAPPSEAGLGSAGEKYMRVATVLGGVVPIYNLKDISQDLRFTPETLAGIYLGKITRWNDPMIRSSNHGIALPDAEIVVIHRSDGSGTTYAWSDFLSKVSAEWKSAVGAGTSLKWPAGKGARGNDGVASQVEATPNSIGYVELVYAIQHELSYGAVRNVAGQFVRADLASVAEAAKEGSASEAKLAASITNSPAKGAYPIATFTRLVLPQTIKDASKKAAIYSMLGWVVTEGQRECSLLGYAPLPHELAEREAALIRTLH